MRDMKGYHPTNRTKAAIDAAVAEANARLDLLAAYTEEELTAMGFDCSSYTADARLRNHFTGLEQGPIEDILRRDHLVWDPLSQTMRSEMADAVESTVAATQETPEGLLQETPDQPVFGTIEDKAVPEGGLVLPVEVAPLSINGLAQQFRLPPTAGITS